MNRPLPRCSCGCKGDTTASQKMKRTEKGRSQNWLTHARARGFPSVDLCAWAQRHATSACTAGSTVTGRTSHCGLHWVSSQINGPAPTRVRRWTTNDQHRLYCCCSAVIKQRPHISACSLMQPLSSQLLPLRHINITAHAVL